MWFELALADECLPALIFRKYTCTRSEILNGRRILDLRGFCEQCSFLSNRINNLQHSVHDHVISVFGK